MSERTQPATARERRQETVRVPFEEVHLDGDLVVPRNARGLVIFAHGSGSSRHSPRNIFVARSLQDTGLATLLFDLLTREEEAYDLNSGRYRFDVALLARRLVSVAHHMKELPRVRMLDFGYFGASTGAAAALLAAADQPALVKAVVSRGGRPDMAGDQLRKVTAPTLLIVGGHDLPVIALNKEAFEKLGPDKQMVIIPGATHLFEEPGALEEVARLANDWFVRRLSPQPPA